MARGDVVVFNESKAYLIEGGWESYLFHKKRQEKRRKEEEERLEQIEAQRLAIEQAQQRLERDEAKRLEAERREIRQEIVIDRLTANIESDRREIASLTERLEALLVMNALEQEMAQREQAEEEQRKRRAVAMILFLDAA